MSTVPPLPVFSRFKPLHSELNEPAVARFRHHNLYVLFSARPVNLTLPSTSTGVASSRSSCDAAFSSVSLNSYTLVDVLFTVMENAAVS